MNLAEPQVEIFLFSAQRSFVMLQVETSSFQDVEPFFLSHLQLVEKEAHRGFSTFLPVTEFQVSNNSE